MHSKRATSRSGPQWRTRYWTVAVNSSLRMHVWELSTSTGQQEG